ncbi:phage tail protein [Pseudomonas sp. NBRC 111135]|uniref:phage tail protein n=1 Tax=Pseudomonas sp. NBRC 111135 TaxID=1661050 RepID=UPI0006D3BC5A|nr:phage tail protein [Pseudomonas sp. NBRC 111135]
MSLSAQIFGRDSGIFKFNNIMLGGGPGIIDSLYRKLFPEAKTPSPTIPTVQDSAYGNQIPRFYGMVGTSGNVIWLKGGKLDVTVKKKKSGGKGGSSSPSQTTYKYYATFALSLGEGPIAGVRRIWCADKLIYNAGSDDLETMVASNNAAKGWKLYRGTDSQMPDPDIQADKGVANTPAYRGLAYIKFKKFALKDYGDSLAGSQFKVEVVSSTNIDQRIIRQATLTVPVPGLLPKVAYISADRVDFWVPGWGGDYPPNSYADRYTFRLNSQGFEARQIISGIQSLDVPPSGTNDQQLFYKDIREVFPSLANGPLFGPADPSYPDGQYQQVGNWAAVIIRPPSPRFYFGQKGFTPIQITENSYAVAVGEGVVYSFTPSGVTQYNGLGTALAAKTFAFTMTANAKAAISDGSLWLYTGSTTNRVYRISLDLSTVDLILTLPTAPSAADISVYFSDALIVRAWHLSTDQTATVQWYSLGIVDPQKISLGDIIEEECSRSALIGPGDIDASSLTQLVTGYRIGGGSIRDIIEPLRAAWPFDARMNGYKLQFVPRGQPSVVSIPWGDLAASDSDEIGDSLPYDREMDTQLPAKVTAKGISATREYADSSQTYERIGTMAVNSQTIDLGLVLSDDELAQIATMACDSAWDERQPFTLNLPPTYQALQPADVVTANSKFGIFDIRLTEVSTGANGIVSAKGFLNSAATYVRTAVGAPAPGPDGTVGNAGESLWVPMDIPVVDDALQNEPGFASAAAGYSNGWPGAVVVRSADGGQTYTDIQGYNEKGSIGIARNALTANSGFLIDYVSQLAVTMLAGQMESITRDQMVLGRNYAAYGVDGRWEIVRFQTATLQTDGSYIVTGLVRGDKGTEWATGLHQVGDYFVLLEDPDNAFIGMAQATIGVSMIYKAVTSGGDIDSALSQSFTYRGVNLKPLSPVLAKGSRDGSGNFSGTFHRRSRLSSSWWTNGIEAPVGEASESYQIDVMSGATVKRTISVTSRAWTYSATDQVTDFGSAQSAITFRLYMISAAIGRGYPLEVTL